jgi:rhamnogalacturonan endolyase
MTPGLGTTLSIFIAWMAAVCHAQMPIDHTHADFGITSDKDHHIIDSGAGLVFKVHKADGSIRSIRHQGGPELQDPVKSSHLGSGHGPVQTTTVRKGDIVMVRCKAAPDQWFSPNLEHYYIVRKDSNIIYMATWLEQQPKVGEFRWITRLRGEHFPNSPVPSDVREAAANLESSDVKRMPDGTSRSKYYGDIKTRGKDRAMDLTWCGVSGPGIGVWMVYGNRESSSGGPFFRDIQNQGAEVYNYMNSGHTQTEAPRTGVLHGPYALVFTDGREPGRVDFSWLDKAGLDLRGHVPASGRGSIRGQAGKIPDGSSGVVAFANDKAQYWTRVQGGSYICNGMKPGTYRATLYQRELEVATATATVEVGKTSVLDLHSAWQNKPAIFRIGEWDGTPAGFLNSRNLMAMHPSDPRQKPWGPVRFSAGLDPAEKFPAILARRANSPVTILFRLNRDQASSGLALRIGITCAYENARPQVKVNGRWTSPVPAPSQQPRGRSYTVGTYRGRNHVFSFDIPATAFVEGSNSLTITPTSGSGANHQWLSPGFVFDCVQLDAP